MDKIGDVNVDLFLDLNNCIQEYLNIFCDKHGIEFDYWVADLIGTIGCFGDYFISFEDIRLDLEKGINKDEFFKWYDMTLELALEEKYTINYYSYIKGFKNG